MSFKSRLGIIYVVLLASIASAVVPLIVAAMYGVCTLKQRSWQFALATGAWLAYAYYEHLIQSGILCGRECNIRADLLLIGPLLAYISTAPRWSPEPREQT